MDISLLSLDNRLQNIIAHLFGIEDASFRDALLNNASIIELDGGDTLFKKGEESDHMYILISGRLHAAVDLEGSQEIIDYWRASICRSICHQRFHSARHRQD